ncbi:MAG TPA: nitrate reductase molybdenum cofactor assembly chaperone [Candidatus Limnocylindrales bacterium]|nr:nitrate reductase molybdenum cofactor assembly chaperone [Candidatus Limnocylindrales bacterium]
MRPRRLRDQPVEPDFFRLLGLVLGYPDAELLAARPAVAEAFGALRRSPAVEALGPFLRAWRDRPASELVMEYVATFDLHKRTGLYLTYYLYGDRRQRGQSFLRLKRLYEAAGWVLTTRELPDYLPLMLEFAGLAPDGLGRTVLAEHRAALELLRLGLEGADSPYVAVLQALGLALAPLSAEERDLVARLLAEGPPDEQVGLEPFAPPELMPAATGRGGGR